MQLQITSIEIYKLCIPLKQPFVISLGAQYDADNILVILRTNKGISGYGECSPYMSINGESMDTCFIVGQYLAAALKGKNPLQIKDCVATMDRIITRNESIKSAFDMALYDIAAQEAGVPLYQFLGGSKNKIISTDMTVGLGSAEKMATEALQYKNEGFPSIKVKLGTTTAEDVARIKAIRDTIGYELPLRIDANQGWDVQTAIKTLQALKDFGIEHCEEPIARWNFMQLPEVRKNSPIKIMSDKSCFDEHDAERLAKLNACDYFNIKLGKSGGIYHALQIIEVAKANKIKLQVGCFMESRLAITALVHFAYCSDLIVHYDLDTPLMLKEDPIVGGMQFKENGLVEIDEAVGIGATVDEGYLLKAEKVIIE
ncbi:MAG: dipeptide epimerase [Chitinophagaceae bacterium]|jgi:L-Ala-D/L-Glu epimerase|nr:dipeptide epimerase [Chitinophagaceae bacterium]